MALRLSELYRTKKGTTHQCDLTNTIIVKFKDVEWSFPIRDFLLFRNQVNAIDINSLLFNLSDECDSVYLPHIKNNLAVTLTLCDLIQLRDLLDGTKFSLELVAMVHEVLGDYAVV